MLHLTQLDAENEIVFVFLEKKACIKLPFFIKNNDEHWPIHLYEANVPYPNISIHAHDCMYIYSTYWLEY